MKSTTPRSDGVGSLPNLPEPINGMIKTYEYSHRTFSRPYSAKTVFFYKDDDNYFTGVRLAVSKARYRNLEALMDDLNERLPMPFGVRRLLTPFSRTPVDDVGQLRHLGKYVCSSVRWGQHNFNLTTVEKLQRMKKLAAERDRQRRLREQQQQSEQLDSEAAGGGRLLQQRLKSLRLRIGAGTPPILTSTSKSKQVLFVLNGKPNQVYRALLRFNNPQTLVQLLSEISEGLQVPIYKLFSYEGKRVMNVEEILSSGNKFLACQRHQQPLFGELANKRKLPPIMSDQQRKQLLLQRKKELAQKYSVKRNGSRERTPKSNSANSNSLPPISIQRKQPLAEQHLHFQKLHQNFTAPQRRTVPLAAIHNERTMLIKNGENHVGEMQRQKVRLEQNGGEKVVNRKNTKIISPGNRKAQRIRRNRAKEKEDFSENDTTAAIKIQAGIRGYLARKNLREQHEAAIKIQSQARRFLVRRKAQVRGKDNKRKKEEHAAVKIQSAFRGHAIRQRIKRGEMPVAEEATTVEPNDDEEFKKTAKTARKKEKQKSNKSKKKSKNEKRKDDSKSEHLLPLLEPVAYTVTVHTGNRWSADSDTDLFVIIHGEKGHSEKHWLRQSTMEPRFSQQQVDNFDFETGYLGVIWQIEIGHESNGYGAGVFIDRVLVAELSADNNRQFVYFCSAWFDDRQVDGLLQRTLSCSGFYSIKEQDEQDDEEPHEDERSASKTRGRWQLRVNGCDGGNTANLSVVGYGTLGRSEPIPLDDAALFSTNSTTDFELRLKIDFGELGAVYKLRVDIDRSGQNPSCRLGSLVVTDRDTKEEMTLICGKSLAWPTADEQQLPVQPFRELPVFHSDLEMLPIVEYRGTIDVSRLRGVADSVSSSNITVELQLIGEYSESGALPILLRATEHSADTKVPFVLEATSLGRLRAVLLTFPVDETGEVFAEGFAALQEMFDKRKLTTHAGSEWVVSHVTVRESQHAPYSYEFGNARILPPNPLRTGVVVKEMLLSSETSLICCLKNTLDDEMLGLTTKKFDETSCRSEENCDEWLITLTTGDASEAGSKSAEPNVTLYGEIDKSPKIDLQSLLDEKQAFEPGSTVNYSVKTAKLGGLIKVRVELSSHDEEQVAWYLKKLKVKCARRGDELRFPVEMWLENDSAVELPAVWPDIPPLPVVVYQVTLFTDTDSSNDNDFVACINLFGVNGDTGARKLKDSVGTQVDSYFKPGNSDTFEVEAVTVKTLESVEVGIVNSSDKVDWHLLRVEVLDPATGHLHLFNCNQRLSSSKTEIMALVSDVQAAELEDDAYDTK